MAANSPRDHHSPPNMTDEESRVWQQMSADAQRQLVDNDLRIRPLVEAQRVWGRCLTDDERMALGGDLSRVWRELGTLGMWMRAKGYTNRFAALAALITAITSPAWLQSQVSLAMGPQINSDERPVWNPLSGVLLMNGKPIRREVRRFKHPSNVQQILNAFQNAGWPDAIANPLDDAGDSVKLHQAVHQLNQTLQQIRFSVGQGAAIVAWSRL